LLIAGTPSLNQLQTPSEFNSIQTKHKTIKVVTKRYDRETELWHYCGTTILLHLPKERIITHRTTEISRLMTANVTESK
jgi:hypothetical protein